MFKKLLSVLVLTTMLLTMFTFNVSAATATISGTVFETDGVTTVPYPPVKLYSITDTQLNTSVANVTGTGAGTYTLTAPSTSTSYFIRAQKAGYNSELKVIDVGTSNVTGFDFTLDPVSSPIPVTGISVSPATLSLSPGGTSTLTATFSPSNASNKSLAWTSNNKAVATVNSTTGKVTAVAAGTANITVTTADGGKIDTCAVTVSGSGNISVTGVTLNKAAMTLAVGNTGTLTATVSPSNATNKSVTWSSNKTSVATVNSSGTVTAVAAGLATITVTTVDGGFKDTCNVAVTASGDMVININTTSKKSSKLLVGYNEFCLTQTPYHAFNDPTYVTTMKDSGAKLMRFPGGTIANFYDWVHDDFMENEINNILLPNAASAVPRGQFATQAEYDAQVTSYKDYLNSYAQKAGQCTTRRGVYGYNDFVSLTSQMGADIYYVGNISVAPSGKTPSDHLVNWMQDLKNKGKTVKYLELGNEVVGPKNYENNQAIPNGLWDLNKYLSVCKDVSNRVRAIFPSIKIGILTEAMGNRIGGNAELDDICRSIAAYNGGDTSYFDALVIHTYIRKYDGDILTVQDAKERLLANAQLNADNVCDYLRKIFPGKELWMTETGLVKGTNDIDVTATMLNAIIEADYMLRWSDNDDVSKSYIKFYSISAKDGATEADGTKYTMFWNTDGTITKEATYYLNQLYGDVLKNSASWYTTTIDNNTTFTRNLKYYKLDASNVLKYYTNMPITVDEVNAKGFISKDGLYLYVPFVNTKDAAVDVIVNPTNTVLSGINATIEYISGNLTDQNTAANPNVISPSTTTSAASGVIKLPARSVGVITIKIN